MYNKVRIYDCSGWLSLLHGQVALHE